MAAFLAAGGAQADVIVWSGSGTSGTDPFGHSWLVNESGGKLFWGIPGLGAGTLGWNGPGALLSMTFAITSPALDVDPNPVPTGPGGFDTSTRFSDTSDSVLWNRLISGGSVTFGAPGSNLLEVGQSFFANVGFIGAVRAAFPIDFTVTYVTVPEPGTLALVALAVAFAGVQLRRRQA